MIMPIGTPAMDVESQMMSARSPLDLRGDVSCTFPVTAPCMSMSDLRIGLIIPMLNLSSDRVNVSFCVWDALPSNLMCWSPLDNSKDLISISPSLKLISDGRIFHSLELMCSAVGSTFIPRLTISFRSRERSPTTMNSPLFTSSS